MDNEFDHYRTYLKIYGLMFIMAADDEEFVGQLIRGETSGALMQAVRDRIQNSPQFG